MTTVLWLGAHKTGTTYLQKSLDLSGNALLRHGVAYMELNEFRRRYTRPLLHDPPPEPPADPADFTSPDGDVHVVFDENIPGLVQHAISRRGLYPDGEVRARMVSDYLRLSADDIIVGIRRYDAFIPSIYCETLKSTRFRTFDDFLARALAPSDEPDQAGEVIRGSSVDLSRLNWHEFVARLAAAFPAARLRVYCHEHLRGREAWLLSEVLGIPRQEITMLEEVERRGFSGRAVDQLHEIHQERPVARADVRRAVRAFPSGHSMPPFYPWSPRETQALDDLYQTHVAQIHADDRLTVIDLRSAS